MVIEDGIKHEIYVYVTKQNDSNFIKAWQQKQQRPKKIVHKQCGVHAVKIAFRTFFPFVWCKSPK